MLIEGMRVAKSQYAGGGPILNTRVCWLSMVSTKKQVDTMHSKTLQRRRHSDDLKTQVLRECSQPGASVVAITLRHNLNANLVHSDAAVRGVISLPSSRRHPQRSSRCPYTPYPSRLRLHRPTSASSCAEAPRQ